MVRAVIDMVRKAIQSPIPSGGGKGVGAEILRLALPSIVTNITVPLLGLIDLAIVGHMGSDKYIATVAVGSMLFNVMYWLMGFLRMSTSGTTAQAFGQENTFASARLLRRSLLIALTLGLIFIACQWLLLAVGLAVMHPEVSIVHLVKVYFSVCIWGAPAVLMLYAFTGWFIGMQNTRITMVVSITQNLLNILLSLFFVYVCRLQIKGVALGTMLSQWGGCLLALWLLHKRYPSSFRLLFKREPVLFRLSRILPSFDSRSTVDVDIFLRTVCLVAVNLFFTAWGAREGNLLLAVNTLLMTYFLLFSYFLDGFAYAAEALCGRYYGADDKANFRLVCASLMKWGGAMIVVFTLLYAVAGKPFLSLLTSETAVIHASQPYFPWVLLVPVCGMAAFIYDGIFVGITASRGMLLATLIATLAFFALFFLLFPICGNHALWAALMLYLALRGAIQWCILHQYLVN